MLTGKGGAAKDGKGKGAQAKDLLARYGSAYLITSISFAILSFGACYALVSSGAPGCWIAWSPPGAGKMTQVHSPVQSPSHLEL